MARDPIAETSAALTMGRPPIGATLYCANFGRGCRWRTQVEDGLRAMEREQAHRAGCTRGAAG